MSRVKGTRQLLFSCEHASQRIPRDYAAVARRAGRWLKTHRGYDPGTSALARFLAKQFDAPLEVGRWSRLLVELNRSLDHAQLWSEFSEVLDEGSKAAIIDSYYLPYRNAVEQHVHRIVDSGAQAVHISVHSFTPVLRGVRRTADVGLLYDPARQTESDFCARWRRVIRSLEPAVVVKMNYPYAGKADGLTTFLRGRFGPEEYLGIELELNQKYVARSRRWSALMSSVAESLKKAIDG